MARRRRRPGPDFTLPGTGGRDVLAGRLRRPAGGARVLPGRRHAGVHEAAQRLQRRARRSSTTLDAQVLGISAQDVDSHERFSASTGSSSRCSPTPTRRSPALYGTLGPLGFPRRSVFIVDGDGVIRYAHRAIAGLTYRPVERARRACSRPSLTAAVAGDRCGSTASREPLAGTTRTNLCSLRDVVLGHRPRADPLRLRRPRRHGPGGAEARGRSACIRTPPTDAAAAAAGRAAGRARGADRRVPARRRRRRAGVLPGQRAHGDERRPGQRAGAGRGRRAPAARSCSTRPNQVKDAVAGWGGADKEQVQRMVQARLGLASPPQPADAADAAALALCHLAVGADARHGSPRRSAAGRAMIGSLRGAVLERGLDGVGAGRGRRRRLPRHGHAAHAGRARADDRRRSCYVHHHIREDARRCTASPRRDERADVRGADRHPRRRAGAGAGDPRHPPAGAPSSTSSPAATSAR